MDYYQPTPSGNVSWLKFALNYTMILIGMCFAWYLMCSWVVWLLLTKNRYENKDLT